MYEGRNLLSPKPPAARQRRLRARRRLAGRCPRCGDLVAIGITCQPCRDEQREAYKKRAGRTELRVLRCRLCDQPGHNAQTCKAFQAAAEKGAG